MARIRSIKPEVWNDPGVVSCSPLARLLWIGTWNHADDYGVLKDDPDRLKLQILPADQCDPHALVDELVDKGLLLRRIAPDGTPVLVVRTFCVHQKIDKRATGRWGQPDTFTAPPAPTNPDQSPPIPPDPHPSQPYERKGREGKRENVPQTVGSEAPGDDTVPPAAATQHFEDHFWPAWPRRHGRRNGKAPALARWKKLSLSDQRLALKGAKRYAEHCQQTGTYAMDAARWLKDRLWEEWLADDPADTSPPGIGAAATLPNGGRLTIVPETPEQWAAMGFPVAGAS